MTRTVTTGGQDGLTTPRPHARPNWTRHDRALGALLGRIDAQVELTFIARGELLRLEDVVTPADLRVLLLDALRTHVLTQGRFPGASLHELLAVVACRFPHGPLVGRSGNDPDRRLGGADVPRALLYAAQTALVTLERRGYALELDDPREGRAGCLTWTLLAAVSAQVAS